MKHGKSQAVETLISEEAALLAKYLRNEKTTWNARIVIVTKFFCVACENSWMKWVSSLGGERLWP